MAEILNGSFETAGATPGEAQDWTFTIASGVGAVAGFAGPGADTTTNIEQFDHGWGTTGYLLDPDDGAPGTIAVFDAGTPTPTDIEQFNGWNNNKPYLFDVNTGVSMEFTPDTPGQSLLLEQFDEGWDTAGWTAEPSEDVVFEDSFDTGWSTDTWAVDVVGGTVAMFDNGTVDIESFENAWPDILFVVDVANQACLVYSMPSYGPPPNGLKVTIVTKGAYPGGLVENQTYFLKNVTIGLFGSLFAFQLSKTNGGLEVTLVDEGVGSHYIHADPVEYWTRFEE